MKQILFTAFILISNNALASGCMHGDERLENETIIHKVADFKAYYYCTKGSGCGMQLSNLTGAPYEHHYLLEVRRARPYKGESFQRDIGIIAANIYRQAWSGSCDDVYRYVFGVDFENQSYRSEADLPF